MKLPILPYGFIERRNPVLFDEARISVMYIYCNPHFFILAIPKILHRCQVVFQSLPKMNTFFVCLQRNYSLFCVNFFSILKSNTTTLYERFES